MIENVEIECDENGFVLVLHGDLADECSFYLTDDGSTRLPLRLTQDSALRLLEASRETIGPWAQERAQALASWKAEALSSPDWDTSEIPDPGEALRERADRDRKIAKGE